MNEIKRTADGHFFKVDGIRKDSKGNDYMYCGFIVKSDGTRDKRFTSRCGCCYIK